MTTRAEEIAAKEYPDSPDREKWPHDERAYVDGMNAALRAAVVKGYKQGQQAARSLAQPPSSEVVSAGNAMRDALIAYQIDVDEDPPYRHRAMLERWDAALAAHPKDPASTAERIMDEFEKSVEAATEPGDEDDGQDWIDINDVRTELTARLKTLFP